MESDWKIYMTSKLVEIWKEKILACFVVHFRHSAGETEENYKPFRSGCWVCGLVDSCI